MNINRPRHRRRPPRKLNDKPPIFPLLIFLAVLTMICLGGVALAAITIGGDR